jgi:DNA-directed RNA polymerase subunit alpha
MPRLMFQRPRRIEWEDLTATFGRMTAEPFEKGYALTVGGSLRRVLLAAIPGTALVWVKVAGVSAGAERVSGVEEDLANLLLNLKKMVVRIAGNAETGSAHLEVRGPRAATGADFAGEGIGVVTPDLHLAPAAGEATLDIGIAPAGARLRRPARGCSPAGDDRP